MFEIAEGSDIVQRTELRRDNVNGGWKEFVVPEIHSFPELVRDQMELSHVRLAGAMLNMRTARYIMCDEVDKLHAPDEVQQFIYGDSFNVRRYQRGMPSIPVCQEQRVINGPDGKPAVMITAEEDVVMLFKQTLPEVVVADIIGKPIHRLVGHPMFAEGTRAGDSIIMGVEEHRAGARLLMDRRLFQQPDTTANKEMCYSHWNSIVTAQELKGVVPFRSRSPKQADPKAPKPGDFRNTLKKPWQRHGGKR